MSILKIFYAFEAKEDGMKRMCIRIDCAHPSTLQPLVHSRNHLRPRVRFTSNSEFPAHHKCFQVKAYFQLTGPFLGEACHKRGCREIHERSMYFPRKKGEILNPPECMISVILIRRVNKFIVFWRYIYINIDQFFFFRQIDNISRKRYHYRSNFLFLFHSRSERCEMKIQWCDVGRIVWIVFVF